MTPAHAAALAAFACQWCGRRPICYFASNTGDTCCRHCLDHGIPSMTTEIQPQTTFAIDIGPGVASAATLLDGATAGLAAMRAQFPRIDSDDVEARVAELGRQWAAARKQVEAQAQPWKDVVKPIQRQIADTFGKPAKVCAEAEAYVSKLLADYRARKQAAVQAQLAHAQSPAEVALAVQTSVQAPEGYRTVDVWSARVVDPRQVPAQFWVIDTDALDKLAAATKGQAPPPPGVEWVKAERMQRTGR